MLRLEDAMYTAQGAVHLARELMSSNHIEYVQPKGDRDMVTSLDLLIESRVRGYLLARTPEIGFLGEEELPESDRTDYRWVLDPIDGTANYIRRLPIYAVALSLLHGDSTVLGVIDMPSFNLRYSAIRTSGVLVNGSTRATCSRTTELSDAIVGISDFALGDGAEKENELLLHLIGELAKRVQRVRLIGSAATTLAWVAEGRLDAAVILSNEPWDTSAGVFMAREAGATAWDVFGSEHTLTSESTVVVNPYLEHDLMQVVLDAAAPRDSSELGAKSLSGAIHDQGNR